MALMSPANELNKLQYEALILEIGIIGHSTQSSIRTFCINNPDCIVYHEDDSRTVTEFDSQIGFALTDLDNDSPPAVLGVLLKGVDAADLVGVALVENSIKSLSMTDAMTAVAVTYKGSAAASGLPTKAGSSGDPSGVTATNHNIAFLVSLTTLNIDEDNSTTINNKFALRVTFRKRGV